MYNYDKAYQILTNGGDIFASLFGYPNECPYCHKTIIPEYLNHYLDKENHDIYATLLCANVQCNKPFVAKYKGLESTSFQYEEVTSPTLKGENFNEVIQNISPQFIEIYNQAFFAEQYGLKKICGGAYRKSLEFLIKDYLINKYPKEKEKIIKMNISTCVNNYVEDERLKSTANRAIWLGNDETHYERKWENKDIADLKILIKLTINWVESEILTKKFEEDMPK